MLDGRADAPLVMGIDLGTASSKGVLTAPDGRIVATATRPRPRSLTLPRPGWAEVDADAVWWADVVAIASELVARRGPAGIAAVCVSGVGPCLLPVDRRGRPLRPAILYGIDTRAESEVQELSARYGDEELLDRTGSLLSSQSVGPKLLWLRRHEPEVWAATARWHNPSSFAVERLTGEYVLDHHTASQCQPLYDLGAATWHDPWYADIAGTLARPRLAWPAEVVGTVTPDAAAATGLAEGTPVCAGTIDAWAESHSVGVGNPGDVMLMYGSTMFLLQVLQEVRPDPRLWTTAGIEPGSRSLAAGMATSGSLTEWVRGLVGDVDYETLVREAAATPAGADGLVVLPYFAGERTPVFDPSARGVVAGLTLRHTRGHLFRAVYEGIAFGVRQVLELLDTEVNPVRRIVAVGGGTTGSLWPQVVSDVTGREQVVPEVTVGAAYGDALLAATGAGLVPPGTDWSRPARVVRPDRSTAAVYADLYEVYAGLYPATRSLVHTLADVQHATHAAALHRH